MAEITHSTGLAALDSMFARTRTEHRAAFLPYFPIGYPDYVTSLDAITTMAEVGVDGFEIGIPFSDPLADGPTIQAATQIALDNGTTVRTCLNAVRELRTRGIQQPMLLMGYLNPILAYGPDAFVRDAHAAGADGIIVPDLPPEESHLLCDACADHGLALVFFLAPTSNPRRIALVAEQATGFIYVVSITGITGARHTLPPDLIDVINHIRAHTDKPLVVGFGISQPEQARKMNDLADGFIVGSALVKAGKTGVSAVRDLAAQLRRALDTA
ncbi:MAG: tryptophan synthase subunit alpha [Anaerolineae bacterium]|nr:tryptophan synthase subunit alpha [Anaerolineae bacterium]